MADRNFVWCKECTAFLSGDPEEHEGHQLCDLQTSSERTEALDSVKEYSSQAVSNFQAEFEKAKVYTNSMKTRKEKLRSQMMQRFEAIVKDLRVALEDECQQFFKEIESRIGRPESHARAVLSDTPSKVDIGKELIQRAEALSLADDDDITLQELGELRMFYHVLDDYVHADTVKLEAGEIFVKFPSTMQSKDECRELAKKLVGTVINSKREAFKQRKSSIDLVNFTEC